MRPVVGLALLVGAAATSPNVQQPLRSTPSFQEAEADQYYRFNWPIQRVAIIGAGPSGLGTYRELTEAGLDVRLFERDTVPGGIWHYTDEIPLDAPVPNAPTPIGDFVPSFPPAGVSLPFSQEFEDSDGTTRKGHRIPRPIWESLISNVPSPLLQFSQWSWPVGTPWEVSHYQIGNFLRSFASFVNINSNDENPKVAYNTRVEHVEKRINEAGQEHGWRLWLRSLEPTQNNTCRATWWTEDFDAVVIAVGKFNAPSMPSIPGLEDWVRKFPHLVRHSRQYRRPEVYANQTVLIVGAATSGAEISRELNHHAGKIYQSFRPDRHNETHIRLEGSLFRIPKNTTLVGEINRFLPIPEGSPIQSGVVELKNGTTFSGIDKLIMATGYRLSYSFLSQYYDGATYAPHAGSAKSVSPFLPSDGSYVRDLYLDQFYIRDPTLAFIGFVPAYASINHAALALAKVWTNTAKLPNNRTMWAGHEKTVKERGGYGKYFLFFDGDRTIARMRYLTGWLNEAAVKYGGKQVDGVPILFNDILDYWLRARFGRSLEFLSGHKEDEAMLASLGLVPTNSADQGTFDVIFSSGDW